MGLRWRPAVTALLGLGLLAPAAAAPSATGASRHVRATLVAEPRWVSPGQPFWVGVKLDMEPGWHTYWKNPGDSGLPTRLQWTLPEGFEAGPIEWPYPERFQTGVLASFGYSGQTLLLTQIRPPASLPAGGAAALGLRVNWLECKEACLPGKAQLTLTLPVRSGPAPGGAHAALFAVARARTPSPSQGWTLEAAPGRVVLRPPRDQRSAASRADFFPDTPGLIEAAAASRVVREASGWRLELVPDANAPALASLRGVLRVERGGRWQTLEIDARRATARAGKGGEESR